MSEKPLISEECSAWLASKKYILQKFSNFFQVWFKNRRAKCRQQVSQAKDAANSNAGTNSNNNKTNIKSETKSPNSKNNSSGGITAVPSETSPASSLTGSECATPGSAGHLDHVPNNISSVHSSVSGLPPPPPLLMQPINSFSLNNHSHHGAGGGGHHIPAGLHQGHDPYADPQTPSPYNNHWVPTGNLGAPGSNDLQPPTRSPSSSTSLVMQVKASNVSPPHGSPGGPSPAGGGSAVDLACEHCGKTFSDRSMLKTHVAEVHPWTVSAQAAAAAGHTTAASAMTHQSYPHVPTYHHPNPYYPSPEMQSLAYFGGQHQYGMAANTAAHMFRSEYVDAYQQAAHAADASGLYQRL